MAKGTIVETKPGFDPNAPSTEEMIKSKGYVPLERENLLDKYVATPEETRALIDPEGKNDTYYDISEKGAERGMTGAGAAQVAGKGLSKLGVIEDDGGFEKPVSQLTKEGIDKANGVTPEAEATVPSVAESSGAAPEVVQSALAETVSNPRGRYRVGSILQAYRDGVLTKDERDYYIVDALATFGSKMADNFGRIAAAYSGGNYTPENRQSEWDARNQALTERGIQSEVNEAGAADPYDLDYMARKLGVEAKSINNQMAQIEKMNMSDKRIMAKSLLNKLNTDGSLSTIEYIKLAGVYNSLLSNGQVSNEDGLILQIGSTLRSLF